MDEDLYEALFEDEGDDGSRKFEQLDDDFVVQAMNAPETPDFDFDAHIADLIARSERRAKGTSTVAPRGWEGAHRATGRAEGASFLDEGGDEVDSFSGSADEGDDKESDDLESMGNEGGTRSSHRGMGHGALDPHLSDRALLEQEFERTLEEYGEEDIGDLGDEEVEGGPIEDEASNPALARILDEFLTDKADLAMMEGVKPPPKGVRVLPVEADEEAQTDRRHNADSADAGEEE
eukprot:gene5737-7323_t